MHEPFHLPSISIPYLLPFPFSCPPSPFPSLPFLPVPFLPSCPPCLSPLSLSSFTSPLSSPRGWRWKRRKGFRELRGRGGEEGKGGDGKEGCEGGGREGGVERRDEIGRGKEGIRRGVERRDEMCEQYCHIMVVLNNYVYSCEPLTPHLCREVIVWRTSLVVTHSTFNSEYLLLPFLSPPFLSSPPPPLNPSSHPSPSLPSLLPLSSLPFLPLHV